MKCINLSLIFHATMWKSAKTSYKHVRNTLVIHMHVWNNSSIIKGIYQITCVIWIHYPKFVYSDKIDIVILVSGT